MGPPTKAKNTGRRMRSEGVHLPVLPTLKLRGRRRGNEGIHLPKLKLRGRRRGSTYTRPWGWGGGGDVH